jgi:hypothetical protein
MIDLHGANLELPCNYDPIGIVSFINFITGDDGKCNWDIAAE